MINVPIGLPRHVAKNTDAFAASEEIESQDSHAACKREDDSAQDMHQEIEGVRD